MIWRNALSGRLWNLGRPGLRVLEVVAPDKNEESGLVVSSRLKRASCSQAVALMQRRRPASLIAPSQYYAVARSKS